MQFAKRLEESVIETIETGTVTKDLAAISVPPLRDHATTQGFIEAIAERLRVKMGVGAGV